MYGCRAYLKYQSKNCDAFFGRPKTWNCPKAAFMSNNHDPPWCSSPYFRLDLYPPSSRQAPSCPKRMFQPQATHLASCRCDGFDVRIIHLGRCAEPWHHDSRSRAPPGDLAPGFWKKMEEVRIKMDRPWNVEISNDLYILSLLGNHLLIFTT